MLEKIQLPSGLAGAIWRNRFRGYIHAMHRHAELEINLVVQGTARYILDDRQYLLGPASIVWLFPGQEHVLLEQSPDFEMWIVVFRPQLVREVAREPGNIILREDKPAGSFCRYLPGESAAWLGSLCAQVTGIADDAQLHAAGLRLILRWAWRAFCSATRNEGRTLHPAVEQAVRLIKTTHGAASLELLGQKVGISPARLSRLFKSQVGTPLVRFCQQQRLEYFLELYRRQGLAGGGQVKMMQLALRAGFGSYPQFHRVFKAQMGMKPGDYAAAQRCGGGAG
ncbi:MAG: AraC family transcriptional regulator [Phycisphaerae bacterium]